ncbi:MAG: inositol monophosphatase [Planctomycetes bacterium]|jgi:myo-inositol-1(or 4)-monophosphatase|nr:inositol monophosphatase [Planctomycetota bacterium]
MTAPNLKFLDYLGKVIRRVHLRHFGKLKPNQIDLKRRRDLLTAADTETEHVVIAEIRKHWPEHSILGEESGAHLNDSEFCWIIDPVDGTTNFARGLPVFACSVGLCRRLTPVLGLVEVPYLREHFTAAMGKGAFLNGVRLKVSKVPDVHGALLATGFPYIRNEVKKNNVDNFGKLCLMCHDMRRLGVASVDLAYVAAGRFDGYWELYLKPWDVAAGALMVREAGGTVTDFEGGDDWLFGENCVASNKRLHEELRSHLSGTERGYKPWGREIEAKLRTGH